MNFTLLLKTEKITQFLSEWAHLVFLLLIITFISPPVFAGIITENRIVDYIDFQVVNLVVFILMLIGSFFYWQKYKQLESLRNFYSVAIQYHFDKSVKDTMCDVDKKRTNLLSVGKTMFDDEHRFSIRIAVPPGTLVVYWKDKYKNIQSGEAIDISIHGIKFYCEAPDIYQIDKIVCPKLKTTFILNRSTVQQCDRRTAAATIDSFLHDEKDQIRWVELITKLYQDEKCQ